MTLNIMPRNLNEIVHSWIWLEAWGLFLACPASSAHAKQIVLSRKYVTSRLNSKEEKKNISKSIILMRLVYGEDHYLLYLSATAVNNRLNIYILPDFLRVIKLAN